MPRSKTDQTSRNVASKASKLLSDPQSTKAVKAVAASALTQAPSRRKARSRTQKG